MNRSIILFLITIMLASCGAEKRVSQQDEMLHRYQTIASTFQIGSNFRDIEKQLPPIEAQIYCASGLTMVTEYQVEPGVLIKLCFLVETGMTTSEVKVSSVRRPIRTYKYVNDYSIEKPTHNIQQSIEGKGTPMQGAP